MRHPKAKIDEAMKSKIIRYRFVAVNLHMITGAEKSDQYNRTLQLNLFEISMLSLGSSLTGGRSVRKQVLSGSATLKGSRIVK